MRSWTPARSLDDFPLELKLRLIENCDLQALIKLRTASKTWRGLVAGDRYSVIRPVRRRLLDLYDLCLDSKYFHRSRRHVVPRIAAFDRDAYIRGLRLVSERLPEEFETWLREWPSGAAIGWEWPGLPERFWEEFEEDEEDEQWRPRTRNTLSEDYLDGILPPHWEAAVGEAGEEDMEVKVRVKCKIFVEREQPQDGRTDGDDDDDDDDDDRVAFSQEPDFEATAIHIHRAPSRELDPEYDNDRGFYDPLGDVVLILDNGGDRFDGTVHYLCNHGAAVRIRRGARAPRDYAASWIEYLRYRLGAYEQLYAIHRARGTLFDRYHIWNEYFWPYHEMYLEDRLMKDARGRLVTDDEGNPRWETATPRPSRIFKNLVPIHRRNGDRVFRGETVAAAPVVAA